MTTSSTSPGQPSAREGEWARPVDRLKVSGVPEQAINLNVEGRRLTGLARGFGQMWQKTYKTRLSGASVTPQEVIRAWKERFPTFWPKGNNLYMPLRGIQPGEVGVINLSAPGGMKLSTGIMVIYADDVSFSFMTPEGHMFAGMITFSGADEDNATVVQIQALIRANDPLYELSFRLGFGHKAEDDFWHGTLKNLAAHFGVNNALVTQHNSLVDSRVQWQEAGNIWHNAGIRSVLYMPVRMVKGALRR